MSGLLQEDIAVTMPQHLLFFQATNLADADTTAKTVEPSSNEYRMNRDGWIVGLAVQLNADITGGSKSWSPTVNGTAKTALAAVTDDTHQGAIANINAGVIPFVASDLIGLKGTNTATFAPTTADAVAHLEIVFKDARL